MRLVDSGEGLGSRVQGPENRRQMQVLRLRASHFAQDDTFLLGVAFLLGMAFFLAALDVGLCLMRD
jgi:hypothetical protein